MACFLVPAAEAAAAEVAKKLNEGKKTESSENTENIALSTKLGWLSKMLWGGSALLAFEHVWHGEVVPWFPFLTAASNPQDAAEMLQEMGTVGVTMALLITAVWVGMVIVAEKMNKENRLAAQGEAE